MIDLFIAKILFYDTIGKEGLLEDAGGNRYEFNSDAFIGIDTVRKGQLVKFYPIVFQDTYLTDHIELG